jgi:hypothetical protein
MDRIDVRSLLPAILTVLFLTMCVYFAKKVDEGPWHRTAVELWENEEWHKLRSLGENLNSIGKEDVEAFHAAMLASRQMNDSAGEQRFASLLSESRALNWKLEKEIARIYQPDSFRKRMALFRTRFVFIVAVMLLGALIRTWRKKDSSQLAPAAISLVGILILWL